MSDSNFNELAKSKRGQGWLGLMDIVDTLDENNSIYAGTLKAQMEVTIGKLILSGSIGCDESAMNDACNQCIDAVIKDELMRTSACK